MRIVVHTPGFDDVDISVGSGRQTFKWLSLVVCQRLESKMLAHTRRKLMPNRIDVIQGSAAPMAGVHPHDAIRDILPHGGEVYLVLEDEFPREDVGRRRTDSVWVNEAFRQGPQGEHVRIHTQTQYMIQELNPVSSDCRHTLGPPKDLHESPVNNVAIVLQFDQDWSRLHAPAFVHPKPSTQRYHHLIRENYKALCTVWDTYAEAVPVGDTFDKRMNVRQWVDCMTDCRIITPANCSFVNPVHVFCMAVMRPKRYQRWRELSAATATSCMIDRVQFIDVLCLLPFLMFGTEESRPLRLTVSDMASYVLPLVRTRANMIETVTVPNTLLALLPVQRYMKTFKSQLRDIFYQCCGGSSSDLCSVVHMQESQFIKLLQDVDIVERPKPVPSPATTSVSMLEPDDSYTGSVVLSGTLKSQSTAGRKISMKKLPPLVASRSLRSGPPSPTLPDTTKSAPVKTGKVGAGAGNSGKPGVFRPSATPGSKTDISAFAVLHEDESIDDAPFPDDNRYSLLSPVHPLLLPPALVTVDEAATVFHSCCCTTSASEGHLVFSDFIAALVKLAVKSSTVAPDNFDLLQAKVMEMFDTICVRTRLRPLNQGQILPCLLEIPPKSEAKFPHFACSEKNAVALVPCPYCDTPFMRLALDGHLSKCKMKPKEPKRPLGADIGSRLPPAPTPTEYDALGGPGRMPCAVCGRNFAVDRLSKHQSICRKVNTKKRVIFDSSAQRMAGDSGGDGTFGWTPAPSKLSSSSRVGVVRSLRSTREVNHARPSGGSNWRQQHLEFQAAIRAARAGGVSRGPDPMRFRGESDYLGPPAPVDARIECPHCSRRFNETAAERHIPKCPDIYAKPKALMRHAFPALSSSTTAASLPPARPYSRPSHTVARSRPMLPESRDSRVRQRGPGGAVVGSFAPKRALPPAAESRIEVAPPRAVATSEGKTRTRPVSRPSSFASTNTFSATSRPSGGISMSNATSVDNPLVTSSFQTMQRSVVTKTRR